jgi:hypothetical protein
MEPSAPQSPTPPPVQPSEQPESAEPIHGQPTVVKVKHAWNRKHLLIGALILIVLAAAAAWWVSHSHNTTGFTDQTAHKSQTKTQTTPAVQGLQLDPNKNYGDKYANGLLPVGDGKYSASEAKQGTVYVCSQYANNLRQGGGASVRGPWFTNNNSEYDINKKAHVSGSVNWQSNFANSVAGSTRTITTNDLPTHTTGVFPIAASDAAYAYDRNPNSIKPQSLTYSLPANPTYGNPNCMGGQVGVMLTGVALFNGFDAGGRDAGAWEVQDSCSGHPERQGEYHYHTLSSCIKDTSVHTVIGFALDGFPITGPQVSTKNILTTSDLDECHGIVSSINFDNKQITSYHYVMTQDFPYSVSCFRGQAIQPPGMP